MGGLGNRCSIQLSYGDVCRTKEYVFREPKRGHRSTSSLQIHRCPEMFLHVHDYVNGARSPQRSVKYLQRPSRLLVRVHAACAAGNPTAVAAVGEILAHVRKVDQDGHPGARRGIPCVSMVPIGRLKTLRADPRSRMAYLFPRRNYCFRGIHSTFASTTRQRCRDLQFLPLKR